MSFSFFSSAVFSPKLEWLANQEAFFHNKNDIAACIEWLWETLPFYTPITESYIPNPMTEPDIPEEIRVLEQQPLAAYLNVWLTRMVEEDNCLREKVALFWHHHMPSGAGHKLDHAKLLLEIYREHGLGNLRDLLVAMAANPAIMYFLDGHWSHKDNPNENFSRELMELFTLGEGNYTLEDVKESARAFTGRRFDHDHYPYSMFVDVSAHDDGIKTILGRTGRFRGDDVIDILLEQPQTARYIARSALRFFFSDNPAPQMIEDCGKAYFDGGYNMRILLQAIFTHPEFSSPGTRGTKVKTPVELLVGFQRQTGLRTVGIKTTDYFLRACGQHLFHPPNVAGWPGGEHWLQGSYLLHRLFLLRQLIRIKNRDFPKNSIFYKLYSRLNVPEIRAFRYIADARWDDTRFDEIIRQSKTPLSSWMTGAVLSTDTLEAIIEHPAYQYLG